MSKKMVLSVVAAILFSTGAFAARSTDDFKGELQVDQLKRGQAMSTSSTSSSEQLLSQSFDMGTNSGGGTNKPTYSINSENIRAITKSEQVIDITGFNFGIEEIKLQSVDQKGYLYSVIARTIDGQVECRFKALVVNKAAMMADEVKVVAVKRISGCTLD